MEIWRRFIGMKPWSHLLEAGCEGEERSMGIPADAERVSRKVGELGG